MVDFFEGGFGQVALLFLGAAVLGLVLAFGVMRAGRLRRGERAKLDQATKARQRQEDP